jgi:AcrR family transcriptional regulator
MPTPTKQGRRPVQDRSVRTVAHILDAARSLLTRIPFAEVTTKRIAAEPSVSVGALYRFFPDKDSIIDAIVHRHILKLRTQFDREFGQPEWQGLRHRADADFAVVLNRLIDVYVVYLDGHPDFRTISFGRDFRELRSTPGTGARSGLTAMLSDLAFLQLGLKVTPEIERKLRVACEAGERLMGYAYEQPTRERRDQIIAEGKKMLVRYLSSTLAAQVSKGARPGDPGN